MKLTPDLPYFSKLLVKYKSRERFTDLDQLNLFKLSSGYDSKVWGYFRYSQISRLQKNGANFKSGQKKLKNNHLNLFA